MLTLPAQAEANQPTTKADHPTVVESARRLHAALQKYAPGAADWLSSAFLRVIRESLLDDPTNEFKPSINAGMCMVALDTPKYLVKIDPGHVKRMADAVGDQERRRLLRQLQDQLRSRMPFRAFDFVTSGVAVLRFEGHDDQTLPQELADAIGDITLRYGFRDRVLRNASGPFYLRVAGTDWKFRPFRLVDGQIITGEPLPSIVYSGYTGDGRFTVSVDLRVWPLVVDLDRGEAHYPIHASLRLLPLSVPIDPSTPPRFPDANRWSMDEWEAFWVGLAGGLDAALADIGKSSESCTMDDFSSWPRSHAAGNSTGSTTQSAAVDVTPAILRAARRTSGQTQAQLAERIGVSKMAVSMWETGRKPIPKNRQAELVQVLGRWLEIACKPSRRIRGR